MFLLNYEAQVMYKVIPLNVSPYNHELGCSLAQSHTVNLHGLVTT